MAATIFVVADGRNGEWTGSGIIVAREDAPMATLTNCGMAKMRMRTKSPTWGACRWVGMRCR